VPKERARRLTVLEEDCKAYHKLVEKPIPVSAVKRKGMETLRETLNSLKVEKEIVKDGIRKRVYDLLDMRRIRRAERSRRKKERKRKLEMEVKEKEEALREERRAADKGDASADTPQQTVQSDERMDGSQDLHKVLGDWGPQVITDRRARGQSPDATDVAPSKPSVTEAHYSLEDRDSQRVARLMGSMFPDLSEVPSMQQPSAIESKETWPAAGISDRPHTAYPFADGEAQHRQHYPGHLQGHGRGANRYDSGNESRAATPNDVGSVYSDSDDDNDDDLGESASMPPVRRFNPLPVHAGTSVASTSPEGEMYAHNSPFPELGNPLQQRRPGGAFASAMDNLGSAGHKRGGWADGSSSTTTLSLRPNNWTRPPPGRDQLYSEDDFASADDVQSGKRRWAPPAPTTDSRGGVLAEARKRFEREWKTELECVDDSRSIALDISGNHDQRHGNTSGSSRDRHLRDIDDKEQSRAGIKLQSGKKIMLPYIGKKGLRSIPRGVGSWRLLGRPPAKILKKQ